MRWVGWVMQNRAGRWVLTLGTTTAPSSSGSSVISSSPSSAATRRTMTWGAAPGETSGERNATTSPSNTERWAAGRGMRRMRKRSIASGRVRAPALRVGAMARPVTIPTPVSSRLQVWMPFDRASARPLEADVWSCTATSSALAASLAAR